VISASYYEQKYIFYTVMPEKSSTGDERDNNTSKWARPITDALLQVYYISVMMHCINVQNMTT